MTENDIKKTWKNTITPLIIFAVLLIVSVLYNRLGSKKPVPQTVSLFASVYCLTFTIFYAIKLVKFRTYIKQLNNN